MRKIITFLGIKAFETTYGFEGKVYKGKVFAEALHQFCNYDSMLVCVTSKAKDEVFPVLESLKDERIQAVDIPNGETTEEMWKTFQIITAKVEENDSVIFDITHGLRSIPFLVFLFAAYLKAAKNITIEAIYYGAFELSSSNNGIAPIIDLSEFITMIDWLTATERFIEIGDGQSLANLIKNTLPSNFELSSNPASRPIRKDLENTAKTIENISLALSITRPIETMQSATKLEEILQQATTSFSQRAKPFTLLSDKVIQEYGQFALNKPTDEINLLENTWLQLKMIEWYLQRDKVVQAATLAREWVISVLMLKFGFSKLMFDNEKGRKSVESSLSNAVEKRKLKPRPINPSSCDEQIEALPEIELLVKTWGQMTELRNDIAHVGMNLNPQKAENLRKKALSILPNLQEIAEKLLPELI